MGFARILKDSSGKASGYRECDGEVAYMPSQQSYDNVFRKVKIDIGSMEVLNYDFIKDSQRVYRKGMLLRGITPEDFHIFNSSYIGNHQVIYTPYGDAKVSHPESFEVLDDGMSPTGPRGYARDSEFVYFFTCSTDTRHAVRLKSCKDPSAFSVLSYEYAKDDQHVYYFGSIIKKAALETFALLGCSYADDGRHIFYRDKLLKSDFGSFKVLGEGYAKDKNQAFYNGEQLKADSGAFYYLGYSYACDEINIYARGKILNTSPKSFSLLKDGYACDDKHIFWEDCQLNADRGSFKVTGAERAEDCDSYFYKNIRTKKK